MKHILLLLSILGILVFPSAIGVNPLMAETEAKEDTKNDDIPTRSYLGLGGNIGLDGESTALSDSNFSIVGRTAFTENLSLHTSTVFGDDNVSAFALTLGVPISRSSSDSQLELAYPFVGGGVAVEDVFGDFEVDGLITAGVDVPIIKRITSTIRLNVGFAEDDTDIGLILGVGYNFSIFELL